MPGVPGPEIMKRFLKIFFLLFCFRQGTDAACQDSTYEPKFYDIRFQKNSLAISKKQKQGLDSFIRILNKNSNYCISIGAAVVCRNKKLTRLIWKRANTVIDYIFSKNVPGNLPIASGFETDETDIISVKLEPVTAEIKTPPPYPAVLNRSQ